MMYQAVIAKTNFLPNNYSIPLGYAVLCQQRVKGCGRYNVAKRQVNRLLRDVKNGCSITIPNYHEVTGIYGIPLQ